MKILLLLLSLFTFAFTNEKEVENDMGYSVYFAMNGGLPLYSPVNDVLEIPDLDDYVPYKSPTETYSYEFGGWYIDDECTSQALTGDPITGNIILHALWIETQIGGYSITFVANGGTPVPDNLTYQTAIPDPLPSISKAGFTFAGWRWGNTLQNVLVTPGELIYADATINAIFTEVGFTIVYDSNGGSAVSQTTGVNAFPSPLPTTTKAGSTFGGWWNSNFSAQYTAGQLLLNNTTVYAKWIANIYNITYNSNGGSAVSSNIGVTAFPSPLPTSTKAGSTFKGWWNSNFSAQYTAGQTINGSLTAYAKWENYYYYFNNMPQGYRALRADDVDKVFGTELETIVYFDTSRFQNPTTFEIISFNGGIELFGFQYGEVKPYVNGFGLVNSSEILDVFYEYDEEESIGEWLKPSKDLEGYQISEIVFGTQSAIYVKNKGSFDIIYQSNGGTTVNTTVGVYRFPTPLPSTYKIDFTFEGWWNLAYDKQYFAGELLLNNTTVYAKWIANLYDITYNSNGGSAVSSNVGVNAFPSPLPTSTKAGSTFKGWWNSNFSAQYTAGQTINGSLTAYAKWENYYYYFNNMPQGYRALRADDVDKVFGTELETIVYFDTSRFQNPTTFEIISFNGGIELFGFQYGEVKPYVNGFGLVNSSEILDVFYEYDEEESIGEWLKPSKDLEGYQISEIVFGTQSAIYVKNKGSFDIIYQSNGGTTVNTTVGVYRFPTPLPSTYKIDFTFEGWWNLAYDKQYFAGELLLNNTTVYAKWIANPEIRTYNVTWNTNGGSPVAQMLGISRLPTPLPVTTKERSTFKGWYTNALFIGDKVIDGQVVNTNMKLYAKFVEALEYELDDGTENVVEKMIQPYNPSSNKVINQNKYFLYAPAAGLDKVGMAGYKSGDFDVNSKQIVSISSKFKKTVIQNVDVNSIPDNIIYEGVDGIKTTNVFYNNYTNTVIDTLNTNNVPSYINVTGTLLVSLSNYVDDSNYSMSEMFIANGRIWTRVLVIVNDEIIEVTDFTQLGKQANIDIPIQVGEIEPSNQRGIWLDESVEGVGVDDVIIVKGTDLQVVGNASGQIPVLQDLIVKGAEISLIEGSSGQIQISGGEITIVNAEGIEEILIDETLTVSSVNMVSGTKYITIKNVIPII